MKMVPMNPAMKKKHQRFGEARRPVFKLAVQVALRDVGDAHQFRVQLAAFLGRRKSFPAPSR